MLIWLLGAHLPPPATQPRSHLCWATEASPVHPGTPGLWSGREVQLLVSCLQVEPVAKLSMHPRERDAYAHNIDTAGHADCHRQDATLLGTQIEHKQTSAF